jgi:hypothetical protein
MAVVDALWRGLKAGLVAGVVFGVFLALVANPIVAYADDRAHTAVEDDGHHVVEDDHASGTHGDADGSHHGGDAGHQSVVPASATPMVSALSGALWAVLLGAVVFGLGFFVLEPAIPGRGPTKSYLLGLAGFVTVSGAPWLVLPPTAPGATQSLPVDTRLLLYGGMMFAGAMACLLAAGLSTRIERSQGGAAALPGAVGPFVLLAVPALLAPPNVVEATLDPTLRAGVTGLAVFGQLLVWASLALAHARLGPSRGPDGVPAADPAGAVSAGD